MPFSNSCLLLYLEPGASPWSDFEARPPFPIWPHTKSNWLQRETPWYTSAKQGFLDGGEDMIHHFSIFDETRIRLATPYIINLWSPPLKWGTGHLCGARREGGSPWSWGQNLVFWVSGHLWCERGREPPRAGSALLTARLARNFSLHTQYNVTKE